MTPENNQAAVHPVGRVGAGFAGAVGDFRGVADAGGAIGIVAAEIPSVQCQKPLHHMVAAHDGADAAAVVDIPGAGAVGIADADVFFGKDTQRFLPADANKFPLAALPDPLHGIA